MGNESLHLTSVRSLIRCQVLNIGTQSNYGVCAQDRTQVKGGYKGVVLNQRDPALLFCVITHMWVLKTNAWRYVEARMLSGVLLWNFALVSETESLIKPRALHFV